MTIKVLIADDHKLFRQGLIGLMETREDLVEVAGEAASGREAVRLVGELQPDVVLMDIYMPDGDGLQALRQIRESYPKVSVVMLTSSENNEHLFEAVRYGASGYLLKNLDADQLFSLLEGVIHGEAALTREMATRLLNGVVKHSMDPLHGKEALTERELAVLCLVAKGASNARIAEELCVATNTVKFHIKNILSKLGLENRTQVAAYALRSGLVQPSTEKILK